MYRITKRLDRWLDGMIDFEALFISNKGFRPASLKMIFENLRYYPVLAFMWVGVKLIREDASFFSALSGAALKFITIGLGLIIGYQTAWIWIASVISTILFLVPVRLAVRIRQRFKAKDGWLTIAVLILFISVISCAATIGTSVIAALNRSKLL